MTNTRDYYISGILSLNKVEINFKLKMVGEYLLVLVFFFSFFNFGQEVTKLFYLLTSSLFDFLRSVLSLLCVLAELLLCWLSGFLASSLCISVIAFFNSMVSGICLDS